MRNLILFILLLIVLFSCKENPPIQVEGKTELNILVVWNTSNVDSIKTYTPLKNAEMILISEYGIKTNYTDENGVMFLTEIPSSIYQISARKTHPDDPNIFIVGNITDVNVVSGTVVNDTIFAKPISSSGISINEIYAGGPVNSIFFFYDQFIELYNSSNKVKYLDGMQIFRISSRRAYCAHHTSPILGVPGADWNNNNNIHGITYAFKFPGRAGENNYPFKPGSFIAIAQDALDHRKAVTTSIDLSEADWEFVNQFSAIEMDNPKVPNLSNISDCKTKEFMINLSSDIILLTSGVDTVLSDGIELSTIIDGVEYQTSGTKKITLDYRIDRGWVQSPPKYNGESMQRRRKGIDTNDGTLDWEVISKPTPGWQ